MFVKVGAKINVGKNFSYKTHLEKLLFDFGKNTNTHHLLPRLLLVFFLSVFPLPYRKLGLSHIQCIKQTSLLSQHLEISLEIHEGRRDGCFFRVCRARELQVLAIEVVYGSWQGSAYSPLKFPGVRPCMKLCWTA